MLCIIYCIKIIIMKLIYTADVSKMYIVTKDPIESYSLESFGSYYTEINVKDIDELIEKQLYAEYKNGFYKVIYVDQNFENFILELENENDLNKKYVYSKFL